MKKIVINAKFGGFGLSPEATLWLWERGAAVDKTPVSKYFETSFDHPTFGLQARLEEWRKYVNGEVAKRSLFLTVFTPDESCVLGSSDIKRDDPLLIECIEALGKTANGHCASLKIVEIPDDVEWTIEEYDGNETIAESHRTWS